LGLEYASLSFLRTIYISIRTNVWGEGKVELTVFWDGIVCLRRTSATPENGKEGSLRVTAA
jgi:hypothetical protein